eukprot:7899548-Pyramimonas_sp.AAC.1
MEKECVPLSMGRGDGGPAAAERERFQFVVNVYCSKRSPVIPIRSSARASEEDDDEEDEEQEV